MASTHSQCAREMGKFHYPELKGDKIYSATVTLDHTFALSLSFESSLKVYFNRIFAMGHNGEQAKYWRGRVSCLLIARKDFRGAGKTPASYQELQARSH